MRKFLALGLSAFMLLSLTACSSSEEETTTSEETTTTESTQTAESEETTSEDTTPSPYDVKEAVLAINTANVMDPSRDVSQDTMTLRGLDSSMYKAYAGTEYPVTPGVGLTLVVEAHEGKVADVETALTDWKDYLYSSNENYPGNITDKIEASKVVTKGNYVIFVIAVDNGLEEETNIDELYENIDIAIDEFFK